MSDKHYDSREDQMRRVADCLESAPEGWATLHELDRACDLGSASKVISTMPAAGYGIARRWGKVPRGDGTRFRRVRSYRLLHRPTTPQAR